MCGLGKEKKHICMKITANAVIANYSVSRNVQRKTAVYGTVNPVVLEVKLMLVMM